jgi:hypothetical protein
MSEIENIEIAKKYLEIAQTTDQTINKAYETVTSKIASSFSLTSALITAIAALGYFIAKETSFYWLLFPVFISISFFVIALIIGLNTYKPTKFLYIDPMEIVNLYKDKNKPSRFFFNKWACTICDTANNNAKVLNSKHKGLNLMYSFIAIGLIVFAISFLPLAINLA